MRARARASTDKRARAISGLGQGRADRWGPRVEAHAQIGIRRFGPLDWERAVRIER
jgi:hypothetical protein